MIKTRTNLQNAPNDKSHRLSFSAFVLKEPEKAAAVWKNRERKKEEEKRKEEEEEEKLGL